MDCPIRALRELMEEVYRLFDRRCRTATAIAKLVALRDRLQRSGRKRCSKSCCRRGWKSAGVLDERLMGATSNAVECGNRRYRKMKDGVPGADATGNRRKIRVDLSRESQAQGRTAPPRPCTR